MCQFSMAAADATAAVWAWERRARAMLRTGAPRRNRMHKTPQRALLNEETRAA
jgi:hypothetical protein